MTAPQTAATPRASAASSGRLRELLSLSGPVVLSRVGIMVFGLCDALVVGRFSSEQLALHALGWAPSSVALVVGVCLLNGVQVMTARALGEGRRREAGAVLRRGVAYALWVSLAAAIVLAVAGPPGLRHAGLDPAVAEGAGQVALVFAFSLPFAILATALQFWLEAISRATPSLIAMWVANAANLAFLLVLVPGGFGLPAMGAVGAAWATFGARLVLVAWLADYILRMGDARALGVFDKPARDPAAEAEQRRVGYGAGASGFFEMAGFASLNFVAGWVGAATIAAWTVVLNVAAIVFMVPLGIGAAAAVLVGRAYGAGDRLGVVESGRLGFLLAAGFAVAAGLVVWPCARLIAGAYVSDAAVVAMAAPALVLACLFFLADALQVVGASTLRARGDVLVPSLTHFVSYGLVLFPLAWWLALPNGLGLDGLVWAVAASSLLSSALVLGRFIQLARRPLAA